MAHSGRVLCNCISISFSYVLSSSIKDDNFSLCFLSLSFILYMCVRTCELNGMNFDDNRVIVCN